MNTYCNLNIFSNGGVHHKNILPFKLYDIQPITLFFFFFSNKPAQSFKYKEVK